mmetsp:Transcript_54234/g.126237  ORF Transcript_54234/g.126237 Transcript_54234/m.126237 type:complete len:214 (-) Transcript_54234:1101-1742(-)
MSVARRRGDLQLADLATHRSWRGCHGHPDRSLAHWLLVGEPKPDHVPLLCGFGAHKAEPVALSVRDRLDTVKDARHGNSSSVELCFLQCQSDAVLGIKLLHTHRQLPSFQIEADIHRSSGSVVSGQLEPALFVVHCQASRSVRALPRAPQEQGVAERDFRKPPQLGCFWLLHHQAHVPGQCEHLQHHKLAFQLTQRAERILQFHRPRLQVPEA